MAVDLLPKPAGTNAEPSVTTLVSGIVADAQELFKQQVHLLQVEVKDDLRQTTAAAITLVTGMATALVGVMLLALAVVHGLDAWSPGRLWLWYLLVGGVVSAVGGVVLAGALTAFSKINPMPEKSAHELKENLQAVVPDGLTQGQPASR